MSGFSHLYVLGGEGGFQGADGINPIGLFVLVGDGNRQWLEPHYVDETLEPLGSLRTLIPARPDHPDNVLDALVAFAPRLFEACRSLRKVEELLGDRAQLDLTDEIDPVTVAWAALREEARPVFEGLNLWRADFERVQ